MGYCPLSTWKTRTVMPAEDIAALTRVLWVKATVDSAAASVTTENPAGPVLISANVSSLLLMPRGVLVASDTNYATVTVYKRTAGGARTVVGALATKATGSGSGSWSPGIALAIPIASAAVLEDDAISVEITKTGSGVIVPALAVALMTDRTWVDVKDDEISSLMNARLSKRYDVAAFGSPPPPILPRWVEAILTLEAFIKRGFNPSSMQDGEIVKRADRAEAQIKEAADSKDGLFDLPLLASTPNASGVSRGGPLAYSEASPYVAADRQQQAGVREDAACGPNGGTHGWP